VCFALGIAAVLACNNNGNTEEDDNQFREDVIWCEDAVARLERCCPNFDARRVECNFYYSYNEGCGTATTRSIQPAYTKEESKCIRERSCEDLVGQGICVRAAEQGAARSSTVTTSSTSSSGSTGFTSSSGTSGTSGSSGSGITSSSGSTGTSGTSGTTNRGPVCQ
jgi:hypothetical protein